jgi:hypothetical protein
VWVKSHKCPCYWKAKMSSLGLAQDVNSCVYIFLCAMRDWGFWGFCLSTEDCLGLVFEP